MRRDAPVFVGAVVVAVVLSLFTGATARRHATAPLGTAPVTARTLVCPAVNGLPQHTASVAVAAEVGSALSDSVDGSGTVTYTVLGDSSKKVPKGTLHLAPTGEVPSKDLLSQAVVITSTGTIASSVVADSLSATLSGRYRGLAGSNCLAPQTDWWFAGGNGKLGFTDRLVLANPSNSQANVAVTAWTPNGVDSPPRLADIRIPALTRMSIGILAVAPNIETVAMHVHAESGAVTAAVVDRRSFGLASDGGDLVPPTLPPSRHPVIAGYPAGPGTRTLVLANPGTGQASVAVKVVTPQGKFTPSSVKPIDIGPGRTTVVDLTKALNGLTGAVLIDSDEPVLAEGRSITIPGGRRLRPDLIWLAATRSLSGPAGVAIGHEPDGGDTLLMLTAPEGAGSVRVTTPSGADRVIPVPAGHSIEVDITDTIRAGAGRWPFVVTPIGDAPIYGTRTLRFHGAHGSLITSEPLVELPKPIPLPQVRQDPRIAVR